MTAQIRVVCTDRGTHGSRELELLRYTRDPHPVVDSVRGRVGRYRISGLEFDRDHNAPGALVSLGDVADPRGALWRFVCPTCQHDRPLRDDTLIRIVEGVIAAGRVSFDISLLPANMA